MLKLLQKSQATGNAPAVKSPTVEAQDFIPQCEHFNAHTLVTKNGELMQTIRISVNRDGLNYEQHDNLTASLREIIRKALLKHVQTDNISFWIHTLRKRKKVTFENEFSNDFANYINNKWRKKHGWEHQYFNEVYVTLIYEGQSGRLFDQQLAKNTLFPGKNRALRNSYLDAIAAELDVVAGNVMDTISERYQPYQLSVVERLPENQTKDLPNHSIYYSEPMEFLAYLLNLREEEMPLPEASIHHSLQTTDLLIGFNALETKSETGEKRFAALLSLKNYWEIPVHTVDMLLQSPMELIISQAFHFIPHQKALKNYRAQKDLFEVSEDEYSMRASGLVEILQGNHKLPTDYGHQQISFMVIVDELKQLDKEVGNLQESFGDIGLVCVREDIRLEEIFWSTLPGNFEFLRRKDPINTHRIGGFARLNRFAGGQSEGNFWSQPIALLPTLVHSPYFFNFHAKDNGHSFWMDFNSFGDKKGLTSLSFLLTQTQKIGTRIYYFDHDRDGQLWFNKMQAPYVTVNDDRVTLNTGFNPFSLPPEPRNIGFLAAWCSELIQADDNEKKVLNESISQFYESDIAKSLSTFIRHLTTENPTLSQRFAPWDINGEYANLFPRQEDESLWKNQWIGFNLNPILPSSANAIPLFSYLIHRIISSLDGTPTIIVLRDMLPILSHPFFAARLESLLEMLKENNAMVIFTADFSPSLLNNELVQLIRSNCASHIIIPDDIKQHYTMMAPQLLTKGDEDLLWHMSRMKGDILLKQKKETVALRINMDGMEDIEAIFCNDIKTMVAAGGPYASIPEGSE